MTIKAEYLEDADKFAARADELRAEAKTATPSKPGMNELLKMDKSFQRRIMRAQQEEIESLRLALRCSP